MKAISGKELAGREGCSARSGERIRHAAIPSWRPSRTGEEAMKRDEEG